MDDITLPPESSRDDDDAFFIRPVREDSPEWEKAPLKSAESLASLEAETPVFSTDRLSSLKPDANDWVRIQFAKFVQLVANHSFIDVVDKNAEEIIIVSSNLLTDLANAHDRVRERRTPLIFLAGIGIGIVLTYIILK